MNIAQQINTSRDSIAYNVIDLAVSDARGAQSVLSELHQLQGVLSTRLIYTGSADAGPSHFQVKDNTVANQILQRLMSEM